MREDYKTLAQIQLVYIHNKNLNSNVIKTLERHGGNNRRNYGGSCSDIYYISPEGTIEIISSEHIPLLLMGGYREIQVEEPIEEFTIEEIAKLLGKNPDSIRIKK